MAFEPRLGMQSLAQRLSSPPLPASSLVLRIEIDFRLESILYLPVELPDQTSNSTTSGQWPLRNPTSGGAPPSLRTGSATNLHLVTTPMHLHSVIISLNLHSVYYPDAIIDFDTNLFEVEPPLASFPEPSIFPGPETPDFESLSFSGSGLPPPAPTHSYESPLEVTVRSGDKEAVRAVLDSQNHPLFDRSLIVAAELGHTGIAELLIDKGASLNSAPGDFGTALRVAAKTGNLDIMRLLLARGASVNIGPGNHGTALKAAVEAENIRAVQLLLDHGASPDIAPGNTGSALIAAAKVGNLQILRLLLDNGADIEGSDGNSGTPQSCCPSGTLRSR